MKENDISVLRIVLQQYACLKGVTKHCKVRKQNTKSGTRQWSVFSNNLI